MKEEYIETIFTKLDLLLEHLKNHLKKDLKKYIDDILQFGRVDCNTKDRKYFISENGSKVLISYLKEGHGGGSGCGREGGGRQISDTKNKSSNYERYL